jgi:hypothetical protein
MMSDMHGMMWLGWTIGVLLIVLLVVAITRLLRK